jgi:hypothetical protein
MTTEEEAPQRVRPFADVLQEIGGGEVAAQVSNELQQLVAAVRATGKAGSVTVQLAVKPAVKNETNALLVSGVVKARKPEPQAPTSVFFVTDDDNLSRSDPHQPELSGLRDVSAPAGPKDLQEVSSR